MKRTRIMFFPRKSPKGVDIAVGDVYQLADSVYERPGATFRAEGRNGTPCVHASSEDAAMLLFAAAWARMGGETEPMWSRPSPEARDSRPAPVLP